MVVTAAADTTIVVDFISIFNYLVKNYSLLEICLSIHWLNLLYFLLILAVIIFAVNKHNKIWVYNEEFFMSIVATW